jgi:hypothetical protein
VRRTMTGRFEDGPPDFERISVVSYYRTKLTTCASSEDESERRRILAEHRAEAAVGE